MALLKKENQLIANMPASNINHWMEENGEDINEYSIELSSDEKKYLIRHQIKRKVGDVDSLVGSLSDTNQLLMHAFASLVDNLSQAKSLEEVRASAGPLADQFSSYLKAVESGDLSQSFKVKGVDSVMEDFKVRSNSIATILQESE